MAKVLSNKQGENRLNKYCDQMEDIDNWGFYGNIYRGNIVIYDMEKEGRRIHLTCDLKTGKITEVER